MPENRVEAPGDPAQCDQLRSTKALRLAEFVASPTIPFSQLRECRQTDNSDVIVFDVEVELPQDIVDPIERIERVCAEFFWSDDRMPKVFTLREDFPLVPHLNLEDQELPRSLCLYDESYEDLKRRWTAARFVERVREWLCLTARGELHRPDQPLEPLFLAHGGELVVPSDLFARNDGSPNLLQVARISEEGEKIFLIAAETDSNASHPAFLATTVKTERCQHGVISHTPVNLKQLHDFATAAGANLLAVLRERLSAWAERSELLDKLLILIVHFPKTRDAQGVVEVTDVWAFLFQDSIAKLGEKVGLWVLENGDLGRLVFVDTTRQGQDAPVLPLKTVFMLSTEVAARINGLTGDSQTNVLAIGAGALGSQTILNLCRAGWGRWTIVDSDRLMPHNMARHALFGGAVGHPKAAATAMAVNGLTESRDMARALSVDVHQPGADADQFNEAMSQADLVLDLSASVSVARKLSCSEGASARRVSVFLNPSGKHLVLLAEDARRSQRLDLLEMQLYREIVRRAELHDHLETEEERLRYARSCGDLTLRMPQDYVSVHAGIASAVIKAIADSDTAVASVWRLDPADMSVQCTDIVPTNWSSFESGGWTVMLDDDLRTLLQQLRSNRLPNETGGVLVGAFNLEDRVVYLVDAVPSPPDSREWPEGYIRGYKDLQEQVDAYAMLTGKQLEYVGEWHSHPSGHAPVPSEADQRLFEWLADRMSSSGLPAVMLIVGERELGLFVDSI